MLHRSLQARLLAALLAGVAAVWLGAAALTGFDVRHELDELLDAHLAQAAALLVVQQTGELEHDDERTLDAPSLHRYAPRAVFQVFHDEQLVLRSADAPLQPLAAQGWHTPPGFSTARLDGVAWRVFAARGGENDVRVFVGERIDARERIVSAALGGTLWPLALALPLLALLSWWAIRRGLAPLRALGDQLSARSANSLHAIEQRDAPAEVAPLIEALNGLFARIDAMVQAERRFNADAAHELRTPIAAIRAQAQVALAESDAAARRHALAATLEGCDRATRLVEQLLTLSRLEAGAVVAMRPVDLAAVARQVVAELAPKALSKQQELGLDAHAACHVAGDETLLAILLRNLVDNALRYGPAGARVNVTVRATPQQAMLSVEDSGPGLDAQQIKRLGQRFQRGLGHQESGSGLGWSIVRRIAEAHGLSVAVSRSATLGGLAVTINAGAGGLVRCDVLSQSRAQCKSANRRRALPEESPQQRKTA
jgi:two-component system, OmpR family, sensor histidine kinase QseC